MRLRIDVRHRRDGFELRADLAIGAGLTALFGPSGSGKTTLVNLVAGLERPQEGQIAFDGEIWSDAKRRIFVPPHRRRIGYVFQEGRLFPHLTVRQNLGYARRFTPAAERRESLERVVDLLGIGNLLDRRPANLSGGEKQRVALGRALMASPRLLLMDEPLSALDNERKAAILPDIERIRDEVGIPILYVSHAIEEVARLATRVVVLAQGRATAIGAPDEVLNIVPSATGALQPGNFLHAVVTGHSPEEGLTLADSRAGPLFLRQADMAVGTHIRVFVPTSEIVLSTTVPDGISTLNRLSGHVVALTDSGHSAMVTVDCNGERLVAEVTRRSAAGLGLTPGKPVHLLFKTVSFATEGLFRQA
ncbi:MAG: molybdenum ABC transporter ATP-binding protein [Rhizobiaceae bacterium]|nr:molybdenum ABC transporter ATP-binding protein [Rhizobiaceae bacterium]